MIIIARYLVILFGFFIIGVGLLMLIKPEKARAYLMKAGSTNLVNYSEITIRMIPAVALVIYSDFTKYPEMVKIFGWFMIATSLVLFLVPRRIHHAYALMCADYLKPIYVRLISPFSILFGVAVIYISY